MANRRILKLRGAAFRVVGRPSIMTVGRDGASCPGSLNDGAPPLLEATR